LSLKLIRNLILRLFKNKLLEKNLLLIPVAEEVFCCAPGASSDPDPEVLSVLFTGGSHNESPESQLQGVQHTFRQAGK
jgi:hypothetical protein